MRGDTLEASAVARGFQEAVVEVLVEKAVRAVRQYGSQQLLLCGGVAANRGLRTALQERCEREGLELLIPPMVYCTDNAAMIGAAAYLKWQRGEISEFDAKADPGLSLEEWSVKSV